MLLARRTIKQRLSNSFSANRAPDAVRPFTDYPTQTGLGRQMQGGCRAHSAPGGSKRPEVQTLVMCAPP